MCVCVCVCGGARVWVGGCSVGVPATSVDVAAGYVGVRGVSSAALAGCVGGQACSAGVPDSFANVPARSVLGWCARQLRCCTRPLRWCTRQLRWCIRQLGWCTRRLCLCFRQATLALIVTGNKLEHAIQKENTKSQYTWFV